ncbi:sugar phosphate isomerase/epimerase family protein [Paenibacillus cremeus]|uniref:Sugar phosphate isomerase/epimerase n=1 Tax=Paenibacillus cremeus TaxID=2163881 RepID=A0A559K878_9BACL|nr:sugar phosphate isomerase/epimerase [Paenibacillus cremeus]TVY08332.1 sugar phosphate isomerase/epimerase [Paenibacillus cremeus]
MALSMGLQLFSVKNALKQDFKGTLERVAEIGYKNLEVVIRKTEEGLSLGGDISPAEMKRLLDQLGMRAVGCHTRVNEETDWDRMIEANHEIGSTAIGCSIAFFSNKQDVLDFSARFNKYGEICNRNGIDLYYHNHFQEFQVFEGQTVMDIMLENTERDFVKFEFDTYWAVRGGVDPIAWLQKLGSRCEMLHQKDLPAAAQPVNWFDVFGADSRITIDELYKTQDAAHFTEVGEGTLNIPAIIQAARSIGSAKYMFVEQDVTARDELEGIAISYKNLSRLLEG